MAPRFELLTCFRTHQNPSSCLYALTQHTFSIVKMQNHSHKKRLRDWENKQNVTYQSVWAPVEQTVRPRRTCARQVDSLELYTWRLARTVFGPNLYAAPARCRTQFSDLLKFNIYIWQTSAMLSLVSSSSCLVISTGMDLKELTATVSPYDRTFVVAIWCVLGYSVDPLNKTNELSDISKRSNSIGAF